MKRIAQIFADNLRTYRKKRKLSQQGLAELMDVSVVTIQNYESLRRWPAPDAIYKLSKALKTSESSLFREDEKDSPIQAETVLSAVEKALGLSKKK